MIPDDVKLADKYDSIEDIAKKVIENSADAQDCTIEELDSIPITAIDEAELPKSIDNDSDVSQRSWDSMRSRVRNEVESRGYTVL